MDIKQTITGLEPITLIEAKRFLKMESTTVDDSSIGYLITAAREAAEKFCNRSFIEKTIEYQVEYDQDDVETVMTIPLPYPTHLTIEEVKVNGIVTTAYTSTGLTKFKITYQGMTLGENQTAVFYAKYTAGDCSESVKNAIKNIIKELYFNRSDEPISENAMAWLLPFKSYF